MPAVPFSIVPYFAWSADGTLRSLHGVRLRWNKLTDYFTFTDE